MSLAHSDAVLSVPAERSGCTCNVVFDGYSCKPSDKDHEHIGRATMSCRDIDVTEQ